VTDRGALAEKNGLIDEFRQKVDVVEIASLYAIIILGVRGVIAS